MRLVLLAALLVGCTDESGSRNALDNMGFTEIQLNGYAWYGCGKGDDFATKFTAKNPAGKVVSGVVCCGIAKSCTLRF